MDEKGCRLVCLAGEDVVVLVGIKEIYIEISENRIFLIIVESICAKRYTIPSVYIVFGKLIMGSWIHEKMTGYKVITVSDIGYINEGICIAWLDHFILYNDCGPIKLWRILLIDGAICYEAPNFMIKATANKI